MKSFYLAYSNGVVIWPRVVAKLETGIWPQAAAKLGNAQNKILPTVKEIEIEIAEKVEEDNDGATGMIIRE